MSVAPDRPPESPPFEIRKRAGVYVVAAVVPLLLAAGLGVEAWQSDRALLWPPVALLVVLGGVAAAGLHDVRTPLFVADDHGVRLRDGRVWVGLLWSEMADVTVERRTGRFDPRVKVISPDGQRIHTAQVGFTTTASVEEAREQLARRHRPAAY